MVVYFVDSGVVCMGDLLFSDTYPVVFPAYGGDVGRFTETLEWLMDLFPADVKYIAGHGRDCSLDDLKAYHQMAAETISLIKQGMADGKSAKDLVEENILKDWEKWSSANISSENWITQVYESLSGGSKKSIAEPLTHTIMEKGVTAAIEQYYALKKNQPDSYNFGEYELNNLGYQLLWRGMNEAAIEMHKLNTQIYPDATNPYDSLGETYEASGEIALAIQSYEKALEIDPEMPSAIEALKRLKAE
jgi:tetratricopeptide (TPR) repeat protein